MIKEDELKVGDKVMIWGQPFEVSFITEGEGPTRPYSFGYREGVSKQFVRCDATDCIMPYWFWLPYNGVGIEIVKETKK